MELSVFSDSDYKNELDGDKNQVAIGDRVYVSIEPSAPLPDTVSFYVRECIAAESTVRRLKIALIDQYECKSDIWETLLLSPPPGGVDNHAHCHLEFVFYWHFIFIGTISTYICIQFFCCLAQPNK